MKPRALPGAIIGRPGWGLKLEDVGHLTRMVFRSGAFGRREFVGDAGVFVFDGGIEAGDDGLGFGKESVYGGGGFHAFLEVAVFAGVAGG